MGDFEDFFDIVLGSDTPSWNAPLESLEPLIDIQDAENEVIVTADLPFVEDRNHIKVDFSDGLLAITAEIRHSIRWERWGTVQRSVDFTSFRRTIKIPHPIDETSINAIFRNGVLKVSLPKITKKRSIPVD